MTENALPENARPENDKVAKDIGVWTGQ